MAEFDLIRSIKNWYYVNNRDTLDSRSQDLRDDQINTDRIKLTVKSDTVQWRQNSPESESFRKSITVTRNSQALNAGQPEGHIQTVKQSNTIGTVTLHNGVIKGLNQMISLPLQGSPNLQRIFGNKLKINLGKKVTILKNDPMTLAVAVAVDGGNASATFRAEKETLKDAFSCEVVMKGLVMIDDDGTTQSPISTIIKQSRASSVPGANAFTSVGKEEVTLKLSGEINFEMEYEHNLELSSCR